MENDSKNVTLELTEEQAKAVLSILTWAGFCYESLPNGNIKVLELVLPRVAAERMQSAAYRLEAELDKLDIEHD